MAFHCTAFKIQAPLFLIFYIIFYFLNILLAELQVLCFGVFSPNFVDNTVLFLLLLFFSKKNKQNRLNKHSSVNIFPSRFILLQLFFVSHRLKYLLDSDDLKQFLNAAYKPFKVSFDV